MCGTAKADGRCEELRRSKSLCRVQFRVVGRVLVSHQQPEGAVEIILWHSLQQASGLELFEVGQVSQRSEPERLQEFPRRHIGERRAGLRGADGAVDEPLALEGGDDVAADLPSRQLRNLPPCDRLQISDRRQRKGLRPRELRDVVPSQAGMGGADRRREAGFGAQRIAAGDEGEVVRAAAQFVDEVGDQIVEPAVLADQADQRLARDGFFARRRWRLRRAASIRASGRPAADREVRRRGARRPLAGGGAPRRS